MHLIDTKTNKRYEVVVDIVDEQDFKQITKSKFFFNWKEEKKNIIYKLMLDDEILGLMSCFDNEGDKRIEIKLLSVSKENRGQNKRYERIAGTLIGYACREATKRYGIEGCVSLVPKTQLKHHYIQQYGMMDAGKQVFLEGEQLLRMLKEYEL
ncbi:MAG TPA: hypothetical protein PKN22_02830 [Taishania sp.]|nr:hypothetical protein [Taishania sp.]HNS41669.1 hypothetical protein [Taishania sp.]